MSSSFISILRRASPVDWLMLTLALASIGLLIYAIVAEPAARILQTIFIVDTSICGVFALEFIVRWIQDSKPKSYPLRYWYDLLGMIPVAHPALRGLRLLRVVRIVVLLGRFGRLADRSLGEAFTYRILMRFKDHIADAVSDAVALRIFDEISDIVDQGTYTQNLAAALEGNSYEFQHIMVEKVSRDPALQRFKYLPFFEDLVAAVSLIALRVVIELLRDHRTDQLGTAVVRENLEQIREVIRERDEARAAET